MVRGLVEVSGAMNSAQEKALFTDYGWQYNYVQRKWIAPNGREITIDQIMEIAADIEGDLALMALIVENGVHQPS